MKVFVGYECSGVVRRAFERLGHDVISCDILPPEDTAPNHIQGDVRAVLEYLKEENGWVPDMAVFHPPCTYHTLSAAWAFNDPDLVKYPDKDGYHQRVQPGTLVGAARREARAAAEKEAVWLKNLPFIKAIENPKGTLATRTDFGKAHDIVQPYEFGHNASKGTCFWFFDAKGEPMPLKLKRDPAKRVRGRQFRENGKTIERWANQTDTGQNAIGPRDGRASERSRTYEGIGEALANILDDEDAKIRHANGNNHPPSNSQIQTHHRN